MKRESGEQTGTLSLRLRIGTSSGDGAAQPRFRLAKSAPVPAEIKAHSPEIDGDDKVRQEVLAQDSQGFGLLSTVERKILEQPLPLIDTDLDILDLGSALPGPAPVPAEEHRESLRRPGGKCSPAPFR